MKDYSYVDIYVDKKFGEVIECDKCLGSALKNIEEDCDYCNGKGYISVSEKIE